MKKKFAHRVATGECTQKEANDALGIINEEVKGTRTIIPEKRQTRRKIGQTKGKNPIKPNNNLQ